MLRFEYNEDTTVTVRWAHNIARQAVDLRPVLQDLGERMVNFSVPQNFREGGRPERWRPSQRALESVRGGQTMVNTGRLRNSVAFSVTAGELKVGTTTAYAAQRHFGGTIKAKGKAITVPVNTSASKSRPKHYGELQWMPGGKGQHSKGLLVEVSGKKKKRIIVRFALKSEVTQPARPFLLWQKDDLVYAERSLVKHLIGGPR